MRSLVFFSLLTDKYTHLALYFLCSIVIVYAQTEREKKMIEYSYFQLTSYDRFSAKEKEKQQKNIRHDEICNEKKKKILTLHQIGHDLNTSSLLLIKSRK